MLLLVACRPGEISGTRVSFSLTPSRDFFAHPWPSDLRVDEAGHPILTRFPGRDNALVDNLAGSVERRAGFSVVPVAYFRFDADLMPRSPNDVIAAEPTSPILCLDLDAARLVPVIAQTLTADAFTPAHVLAVSPAPGDVLRPRPHAILIMRSARDENGDLLGAPKALRDVLYGYAPNEPDGPRARDLFAPLRKTLARAGVAIDEVAAATVFTPGDVVTELSALSDAALAADVATVTTFAAIESYERFDAYAGSIVLPKYQTGSAPFATGGEIVLDGGRPVRQGEVTVPFVVTLPKTVAPDGGFPLVLYIHGSGGVARQVIDRGRVTSPTDLAAPGSGPAEWLAREGVATASLAMPVNPERVPGAGETEYLNFSNLGAFANTFRQGVIDLRFFLRALGDLPVELNTARVGVFGQSMGGQYTNLLGPVEPRAIALVPSGAGGQWSRFVLETQDFPGAADAIRLVLGADGLNSHLHPALALLQLSFEPADSIAFVSSAKALSVYQPIGDHDHYVPRSSYDAIVRAYGHVRIGARQWQNWRSDVVEEEASLPLALPSGGACSQHSDDGILSGHDITFQSEILQRRVRCFFGTALSGGAVVVADAPIDSPCVAR